jgi:phosphatidylserine/phosphatidylglycerophosphate/cardiolipin synthase-like enzyme
MKTKLVAFANCDDALIYWRINSAIPNCWGFALEREMKDAAGTTRSYVENRTGFKTSPGSQGETRPSNVWPFQRFSWTDHRVNTGDTVRYRVTPVLSDGDAGLELDQDGQSDWSEWLTLSGDVGDGVALYFNRGLVISQFMSRYIKSLQQKNHWTFTKALSEFKKQIKQHEVPIRTFLSGELRLAMLKLIDDAGTTGHLYAALFELGDDELIEKLSKLGERAHVVLADGSVTKVGDDENKTARKDLNDAGVEVFDRKTCKKKGGPLAHNKFVVLCDAHRKPKSVWTGSTNWTSTGLCTQINNGLLVEDPSLAKVYLDQWDRLSAAGDQYPKTLVDENSEPDDTSIGTTPVRVWFTRTTGGVDLDALDEEINAAKEAILFLMFMPGGTGLYRTVREKMKKSPDIFAHGVVSTLPELDDESEVDATTVGSSGTHHVHLEVVQPEGIKAPFASWAATVLRGSFMSQIGHAIVHSKLVVIDPFTKAVVITGSHNFSGAASKKNDENFVIIRGQRKLAQAYCAHITAVYQHYRWLSYVKSMQDANRNPWAGLEESDSWQTGRLKGGNLRELKFWVP